MLREVRDKWCKFLRENEDRQVRGTLKACNGGEFWCALGALLEVSQQDVWYEPDDPKYRSEYLTSQGVKFLRDIGAKRRGTHNKWWDTVTSLSVSQREVLVTLNDTKEKSFSEIADWVETNIEVEDE